jgi:hypothetical protein
MGRRLIATMAILAIGFVGALSIAAPASATTGVTTATEKCSFPEPQSEIAAKALVPQLANCLEVVFTDKCDGTTLVQATNWVTNDNKWTVLKLKVDGTTQTLRGGSTPDVGVWNVSPPNNRSDGIQPLLVYDFTEGDISVHIEKKFGDPHVWKDPGEVCQSPSPSPSASASASPSPSAVSTTAASTSTSAPVVNPQGNNDLPVTGASATLPIVAGSALLVGAVAYWGFVLYRRRKAEIQA